MNELNRRNLLLLLATGTLFAGTRVLAQETTSEESSVVEAETTEDSITQSEVAAPFRELALGAEDAPVTIIEYASLTCPHCARFHNEVLPLLKADYIDIGKVRLVYREVYFDGPGLWAAMVARCGGESKYFGLLKLLYERQPEWSRVETQAELVQGLFSIGKMAGLTEEEMTECLQNNDNARTLVATFKEHMEEHEISGTPSFVINGDLMSNLPYNDMKFEIDSRL